MSCFRRRPTTGACQADNAVHLAGAGPPRRGIRRSSCNLRPYNSETANAFLTLSACWLAHFTALLLPVDPVYTHAAGDQHRAVTQHVTVDIVGLQRGLNAGRVSVQ